MSKQKPIGHHDYGYVSVSPITRQLYVAILLPSEKFKSGERVEIGVIKIQKKLPRSGDG